MASTLKKSKNNKPNLSKMSEPKLLKLGKRSMEKQDYANSLAYYNEIWERNPEDLEVLVILSFILTKLAYRDQALLLLERALERIGPREDILQIMGDMSTNMSMFDMAVKIYRIQIELYPDSLMAYNNLASNLGKLEEFDQGIDLMKDMLEIYPDNHSFWNTLGGLVCARDGESAGIVFYEEAGRLNPDDYRIANNLARSYLHLDRREDAMEQAFRTIELNQDSYDAKYLLAECYLSLGVLDKGWNFYEMRRDVRKADALVYTCNIPDWDGSDLKDKSILVMSEQGLGDEILFAAGIHHLYETAKQLYIGCDKRLIPLFQRTFPKAIITHHLTAKQSGHIMRSFPEFEIPMQNGEMEIDYRIPICTIPKFFWTSLEKLPNHDSFLVPDQKRKAHWQKKLDAIDDNPKVGITWRSGHRDALRDRYYTDIEAWGPILKTKGLTFINMQYGDCDKELAIAKEKFGVTIHNFEDLDLFQGIDDSCAMFSCLDLALTPGNAPGIQAASVGTHVWWMMRGHLFWNFGESQPRLLPRNRIIYAPVEADTEEYIKEVGVFIKEFAKTHDPLIDKSKLKQVVRAPHKY